MFLDQTLKKYRIDENNNSVGELNVNSELIKNIKFFIPFYREKNKKTIIKVGERNNTSLNQYIIASMTDYYNRLTNASKSEYKMMLDTYNRLYGMWRELYNYKKNNNLVEMDKVYDLFSYELYVLGYNSEK